MELDEKVVQELKQRHGQVYELSAGADSIVVRSPTGFEFRKWRADTNDERRKIDAPENLLLTCTVWPDQPSVSALFDKKPGLVVSFFGQLIEIAGVAQTVEKKEL